MMATVSGAVGDRVFPSAAALSSTRRQGIAWPNLLLAAEAATVSLTTENDGYEDIFHGKRSFPFRILTGKKTSSILQSSILDWEFPFSK